MSENNKQNAVIVTQQSSLLAVSKEAQQLMPLLTKLALANMKDGTTHEQAERTVTREVSNLEAILNEKPELSACTTNSKIQALKNCINNNLSLAPSANLVYLIPGQITVGTDASNQPIREWVVQYKPTANGNLSIARQAGRVFDYRYSTQYDDAGHVHSVTVIYLIPTIGGTRWSDPYVFMKPHFNKWKKASASKNKGNANANYTSWNQDEKFQNGSIDPDFALSKAINHSLKRLGTNMNEVAALPTATVINTPNMVQYMGRVALPANGDIQKIERAEIEPVIDIVHKTENPTPLGNANPAANPVIDPNAM
jgi:hypothetical protein